MVKGKRGCPFAQWDLYCIIDTGKERVRNEVKVCDHQWLYRGVWYTLKANSSAG